MICIPSGGIYIIFGHHIICIPSRWIYIIFGHRIICIPSRGIYIIFARWLNFPRCLFDMIKTYTKNEKENYNILFPIDGTSWGVQYSIDKEVVSCPLILSSNFLFLSN